MTRRAGVRRRAAVAVATAVAAALALAGCAGLPTNGYVQAGEPVGAGDSAPRWLFSPDGPADDARPEDIVLGFLAAAESPVGDWATAREFLLDDIASDWDPSAGVTIDSLNDRTVGDFTSSGADEGSGSIDVTLTPTATLDEHGEYELSETGAVTASFALARDDDGEWRIAEAPDGIVVQSGNFPLIFESRTMFFFDPSWTFLVPDVRWQPSTSDPVETITAALVDDDPASWLEGAAVSAFDADIEVIGRASGDDGVADVTLSPEALSVDPEQQARMLAQLQASLAPAGIDEVRMTSAGERIRVAPAPTASTLPDARPVVLLEDDFGHLAGGSVEPIEGLTDAMIERFTESASPDDPATSIAVARDFSSAAVQTRDGTVWRASDDATFQALAFGDDLVAPAMDPFGYIWTTSEDDPSTLRRWAPGETEAVEMPGFDDLQSITDVAMSRDGARVAIAARSGGDRLLLVAGVERDESGAPVAVGEPRVLADLEAPARSIAWVSGTIVAAAVVADGRTSIVEQTVGGQADRLTVSIDVTSLTYGNPQSAERLLSSSEVLYVRRATTWQQVGEGIDVLATQLGAVTAT